MSITSSNSAALTRREGISETVARDLAAKVDGHVLLPGDSQYDSARRVFNAMIDRRPALILRCFSPRDVIEGVRLARQHGLPACVKGGGHSVAGTAVCDDGLMLDLSPMKGARVNPERRVATVQAGLTLADIDRATQAFGLATPTGVMSGTGLSGLALGGGLGWLNGRHGLTCDNLVGAEVVTADAELITAGAEEHDDLLWALRGGGGNFGVVTSLRFGLYPVAYVLAGAFTYAANKATAALRLYREFAADCPDALTANASLSRAQDGEVVVSIAVCYAGAVARGEELLAPLRRLGPEQETVAPMSYLDLQRIPDPAFPSGQQHYWKSGFVTAIDDELIDVLIDGVARMPSPTSGVGLQQLHGAASRVAPTATAFAHRGDRHDCLILSQWPEPARSPENIAWTRALFNAIQPHLADGVYVNNLGVEDEPRIGQAYGPNYERLVAVKTRYDPLNFFAHNHNIAPTPAHDAGDPASAG